MMPESPIPPLLLADSRNRGMVRRQGGRIGSFAQPSGPDQ